MTKKEKIYAVHDRDLEKFLAGIGLLERINRGEIRCATCEHTITLDNLGFVFPIKNEIEVCCDNPKCYYDMVLRKKEREQVP
jgi:hypothetical protein